MENLNEFEKALLQDFVPEKERAERTATLIHCLEFGEKMSAKLKAKQTEQEQKRIKVSLRATIEWCIISFLLGACAMSYVVQELRSTP